MASGQYARAAFGRETRQLAARNEAVTEREKQAAIPA